MDFFVVSNRFQINQSQILDWHVLIWKNAIHDWISFDITHVFLNKAEFWAQCVNVWQRFFLIFLMAGPYHLLSQYYFLQSSSVLQSRLASTSRAEGDTFTSNDVTANDNHQLLVGSIINPRGFSKEGMYFIFHFSFCYIHMNTGGSLPLLIIFAWIRLALHPWPIYNI